MLKPEYGEMIQKKIEKLQNTGRLLTNCYSQDVMMQAEELWDSEKGVLFSYDDHGIKRLIYYTLEKEELGRLLKQAGGGKEYVLDFLTRNAGENKEVLESAGFQVFARMMRVSNPNCGNMLAELPVMTYFDDTVGYAADISETHEIKEKMWLVFDTRVSHLLDEDELMEVIMRKEIDIHRNQAGEIDAFLQALVQPKRFYINQIYNSAEKNVIHAMLLKRLQKYAAEGGQYLYAWVEEGNSASLKFHGKYGMKPDGMWNMVYMKEGTNSGTSME